MAVRTHTTRSTREAPGGVEVRLPWWAVVLPAVAFAALLLMVVEPGQAHAATGDPAIGRMLGRVLGLVTR